jgi:hypothetical protein
MALDPVTSINLLRMFVIRPLRNRRRAKRGLPPLGQHEVVMPEVAKVILPDGREIARTEPVIPARSSTKSGTIGLVSLPVLQLLQEIPWPWPWVESLTDSAAFAQVVTIAMMYITARYTKTPADGGVL